MASDGPASRPASRRHYSAELKAQVMAQCDAPGASVARVALAHGINANVVHRWRQRVREGRTAVTLPAPSEFVPVSLTTAAPPSADSDIRIELRRGATAMTISWPLAAAAECAGWLREWLK
jgi:transposase